MHKSLPALRQRNLARFPSSRERAAILVERAMDDDGCLLVVTPNREYGWLHCTFNDALRCAREIGPGYGVTIVSSGIAP